MAGEKREVAVTLVTGLEVEIVTRSPKYCTWIQVFCDDFCSSSL